MMLPACLSPKTNHHCFWYLRRRFPSHNSGLSGDSIQRVVQPTVTDNGEKAPALRFGQPRVMALFVA
jgi:hypothetical protein